MKLEKNIDWKILKNREEIIKETILKTIDELIDDNFSNKNIIKIEKKHEEKIHFIPKDFRVFNGLLQSLNIKFGTFIEKMIVNLLSKDSNDYEVHNLSRKKINFFISNKQNQAITNYINFTSGKTKLEIKFDDLLKTNGVVEKSNKKIDIDLLLRDKENNFFYFEIKYNDDHDTGKIVDINKKILQTYFSIKNKFVEENVEFKSINFYLYYFNEIIRWDNRYLKTIRGAEFWEIFSKINYETLKGIFYSISESDETIKKFKKTYEKIIQKDENNS